MDLDSLRFLMTAFAFACQYGENTENAEERHLHSLLQFSSSSVYSKLMIFALKVQFLSIYPLSNIVFRREMESSVDTLSLTRKNESKKRT